MTTALRDEISHTFAAIRPVSACIRVTCVEAALSAHGSMALGNLPRGEAPARYDTGDGVNEGLTTWIPNTGIDSLNDFFGAPRFTVTNATKTVCLNWFPQDSNDFDYRAAGEGTMSGAFQLRSYTDSTSTNVNKIYVPFITNTPSIINSTSVTAGLVAPNFDESSPIMCFAVRGGTAGATSHSVSVTINYEAIPLSTTMGLMSPESSPANPLEEAQALNTVRHLPTVRNLDVPNDPPSAMYRAAAAAATHLDRHGPTKNVVEGRSFLSELGRTARPLAKWASENSNLLTSAGSALLALL
jgi:hypothetical protein